MRQILKSIVLAATLAVGAAHAAFPERTITIVVPYAPGGAADALARQLAVRMGTRLGTSVIVDNKPGASGTIGQAFVARATADGYTMLYDATPFSINPALYPSLPFTDKSFQPLSLVSLSPNVVIVRKDSPIKDQKDLIARAKAQPGKITFASGGSGTVQRLAAELYRQGLDLDMLHVPYKSGGPAISDVMGGQVDFMFSTLAASYPLVSTGKLRALAISSTKRSPLLPDVATVAETSLPGYEAYEWNGLLLPAGTPDAVVQQLHKAVVESLQDEELKKRFADMGAQAIGGTPAEFATFLQKESTKWATVIRKGNIKLD
ncbi:tripartite tricarboxylate transporter substrate binding protein [Xylophilus sp. GOD-11R]|uniref:Bug family tripartite tricarboxylate transporter substrate binding protein n=1 Tax=Xylophilus sp. GOD-11R TaxID=3089814 RepID=UPI00298D4B84|nr:tripartite tricarboxylate transporter substrate binding protein [Xylophilus sp. GOD-11R]WPB58439.1 tripartite tricarboxylate transporter substrate binding protein [Xylophilus sp. GOD-11R]